MFCDVLEFTIYALTPDAKLLKDPARSDWMKQRLNLLNREQSGLILEFLTLVLKDEELAGFHTQLEKGVSHLRALLCDLNLLDQGTADSAAP